MRAMVQTAARSREVDNFHPGSLHWPFDAASSHHFEILLHKFHDELLVAAVYNSWGPGECVEELPLARCQPTHHVLPPTLIASTHRITLRRPHQWSFATQSGVKRT